MVLDCNRSRVLHWLQHIFVCPSDKDTCNAIENNVIGNNPFTRRDVRNTKTILGPRMTRLKGKTVKQKSKLSREDNPINIPPNIAKRYCNLTLSINVMHVN